MLGCLRSRSSQAANRLSEPSSAKKALGEEVLYVAMASRPARRSASSECCSSCTRPDTKTDSRGLQVAEGCVSTAVSGGVGMSGDEGEGR